MYLDLVGYCLRFQAQIAVELGPWNEFLCNLKSAPERYEVNSMVSQFVAYCFHLTPLAAIWVALLYDWLPYTHNFTKMYYDYILHFPIYAVFLIGIYAICSVLYGVATFNDCAEAQEELREEINEAKMDLRRRNVIS
ncbi:unnamed protein product [Thelazia callipaeda]|uniref:Dolichol-phosphate mannosyltransferase subunit 3 n=1 Tax=Thelazia callipaeda TaxID=103827 RepID=A0A0N5D5T7_THECL|nr:unnamed protein product [Thelazia callipaeda]